MCATPFAPRISSFFAGEASQATASGSHRQLRLDERGAVVLAIVLVLIVLRCDEALDGEVLRPFKNFVGGALRRYRVAELRITGGEKRQMAVVGAVDPLECLDCLAIAPRDEISAAEMTPEALWMIGVQAHSLLDPFDAWFRLADPGRAPRPVARRSGHRLD